MCMLIVYIPHINLFEVSLYFNQQYLLPTLDYTLVVAPYAVAITFKERSVYDQFCTRWADILIHS